KIVSGVNEKYIWECLRDKVDIESQLVNIPDELFQFVKDTKAKFQSEFLRYEAMAELALEEVVPLADRKTQAQYITQKHKGLSKVLFLMLDKRDHAKVIWNMIEPEFTKPRGMGE